MVDVVSRRPRTSILPDPRMISLARGIPAPDTLPVAELARCAQAAIERHGRVALNYGDPEGFRPLCDWLAERHGVSAEQVLVTPGSFLGLSFLVRELLGASDSAGSGSIAVEAPCYDRMIGLLRSLGAEPVPIARRPAGLDLACLREVFAARSRPSCLYVLPTFHNPTGLTLSLEEREQLVDLAVELEIPVLEDDPYGLLRLDGEPLPHLHTLLRRRGADRLAIHLSSFSKTVSPGLRVGYVIAPEALIARLRDRAVATYVSPPILAQAELYEFLGAGHLPRQLERVRSFLRPRRDALLATFDEHMPPEASWTRPDGGYFVWLELPRHLDAETFAERAARAGVSIVPGPAFFAGSGGRHAARLSFSFPTVEQIRNGAARLADLARG
jgi:2-aminoadipate transaminase